MRVKARSTKKGGAKFFKGSRKLLKSKKGVIIALLSTKGRIQHNKEGGSPIYGAVEKKGRGRDLVFYLTLRGKDFCHVVVSQTFSGRRREENETI